MGPFDTTGADLHVADAHAQSRMSTAEQHVSEMDADELTALKRQLYNLFIGHKDDVMGPRARHHRPWNVFAFLFGGLYFLYRRVYRAGAVLLAIQIIIGLCNVLSTALLGNSSGAHSLTFLCDCLSWALSIASCLLFYTAYDRVVNARVDALVAENPDATAAALRRAATAENETSLKHALIALGVTLAISVIIGVASFTTSTLNKASLDSRIDEKIEYAERFLNAYSLPSSTSSASVASTEFIKEGINELKILKARLKVTDEGDLLALWDIYNKCNAIA